MDKKIYLGDGAYAAEGSYQGEIVLTTEDGISVQNTVVMDAEMFARLCAFVHALVESYEKAL